MSRTDAQNGVDIIFKVSSDGIFGLFEYTVPFGKANLVETHSL